MAWISELEESKEEARAEGIHPAFLVLPIFVLYKDFRSIVAAYIPFTSSFAE